MTDAAPHLGRVEARRLNLFAGLWWMLVRNSWRKRVFSRQRAASVIEVKLIDSVDYLLCVPLHATECYYVRSERSPSPCLSR